MRVYSLARSEQHHAPYLTVALAAARGVCPTELSYLPKRPMQVHTSNITHMHTAGAMSGGEWRRWHMLASIRAGGTLHTRSTGSCATRGVPDSQACIVVERARCVQLGPDALVLTQNQPIPTCGTGEVLIKVAFAGVNRPDLMQRSGLYPPPTGHSATLGLEVSGTVAAVGTSVIGIYVGQKVCALTPGGGYAQFVVAPAGCVLPVPVGMSMRDAAALPETLFTVYYNVFMKGMLQPGQTLLVHGGAGGIGTTAIQMAKALGAKVFTTAGTAAKCALCARLGADLVVNHSTHDFVLAIKERLGKGRGVDVVLDIIGGEYINRNLKVLGNGGRHVSIAFQRGSTVTVDLLPVLTRSLQLTGSTMRPRSVEEKALVAAQLRERIWPLLTTTENKTRRIEPVIHSTLALKDAATAHHFLEAGQVLGKLVLEVDGRSDA